MNNPRNNVLVLPLLAITFLHASLAHAQTVHPDYDDNYTVFDLGMVPGVPENYGGLTLHRLNSNTLLIGGAANSPSGAIYSIGLTRDVDGHINGFTGSATSLYPADGVSFGGIDGGLAYGPANILFYTSFPDNSIGQIKPGSTSPDKKINLNNISPAVSSSVGSLVFVPQDQPGAGGFKILSYSNSLWYNAHLTPDGLGTYDISVDTPIQLVGGIEGAIYVPGGSPLFPNPTILVCEYALGAVVAYDADSNGDPIPESRREFITGLSGAEGAFLDPQTGDFLFSTFGGGSHVVVVRGFASIPTFSLADFNSDGFVDGADFSFFLGQWGPPGGLGLADFNTDNTVDGADFSFFLAQWNPPPPGLTFIPEPTSVSLLVLAGLSQIRRRRTP